MTNTECQCWSKVKVILKPLHALAAVTKQRAEGDTCWRQQGLGTTAGVQHRGEAGEELGHIGTP